MIDDFCKSFESDWNRILIEHFPITPHVLRASAVTYLKQQGFSYSDVMRVTGHASAEMIYAYDKASLAENASRKVHLIS